jgi:ribosomal protein S18 acetylase RimI-like enzyme
VPVENPAADAYAASFDARCAVAAGPGTERVRAPGIRGLVSVDGTSPTQLLVLDDRAFDELSSVLPRAAAGTIRIHDAARRCAALLRQDRTWAPNAVTGMVSSELRTVPDPPLPAGLTLRPVCRVPGDGLDGVPLADAVGAAGRATGAGQGPNAGLVTYLRSLPPGARLCAAVDGDGVVRGTSGSRTFGSEAYVFFVNTDPGWQRRGVGLSMTAVALRAAATSGATRASLDASESGVALYQRLGFTAMGRLTQFSRSA